MKPLAGLKRLGAGILPTAVFALVALALIALMPSAGLCADTTGPGVKLSWSAPGDVAASKVTGYNIYRSDKIMGHYELINKEPLKVLVYEDRGLPKGKEYFYKVCTVFTDGRESEPSTPVGNVSGAADGSPEIDLPRIEFFTSAALDKITYAGEEAVFILNGNASMTATMDIPGVVSDIPMTESKPGTYKAVYVVKSGDNYKNIPAVATLKDKRGGVSIKETPATLSFSGSPKPSLAGLYAGIVESDRVGLNWPRAELGLDGYYSIYRDISRIISIQGMRPLSTNIGPERSAYIDRDVMPGTTYYYVLAVNQPDGSISAQTENLKVVLPDAGHISGIDVAEDSAGRQMKPGDTITVTATMKTGGKAFYAIGTAVRQLALSEVTPGVYKASYTFREGDGVFKTRVAVSYKDASGVASFANSATFVDVNAPRAAIVAKTGPKPVISEITDDIQSVVGRSGRLVAGKTFHVSMKGDPGNRASFSIGEGIWRIAMKETTPGEYSGEYTVKPGDWAGSDPDPLKREFVVGLLESPSGAVSDPVSGSVPVVVDTTCTIDVALDSSSLPADGRSRTRVVFTATDADGEPVADRRISVLLEPPAGYTGVAGGGGMDMTTDAEKAAGTLGRLELDFDDMTDSMGRVAATYTAGLAAKTAMLVGRDFMTGSLGIGYVTTTITSSVSIKLTEPFGADKVTAPNASIRKSG